MERIKTEYDQMHEVLYSSLAKKLGGAKGVFLDGLGARGFRESCRRRG